MKPSWILRALSWLLWLPPRRWVLGMGAALGMLVYTLGIRRRIALDNARFALGDESAARAAVKAAYRNLGTYFVESFMSFRLSDAELARVMRFDDMERLDAAIATGKGVVLCAGHFGNWELLALAAARRRVPFTAITRKLKGAVNALVVGARTLAGVQELGPSGTFHDAVALLQQGKVVALIIDQNMLRKRGIFVDFFGRQACTTPAPAVLAERTGALVMAVFPVRDGPMTYRVLFEGPFDPPQSVEEHTQRMAKVVESYVRKHPDHWFWLHRRWKTRPESELAALQPH